VRHGQASARARDYDVLAPLSARRRALGSGRARRRGSTPSAGRAAAIAIPRATVDAARAAGAEPPDAIELPSSDEPR
jgi:hypothetical protein